MIEGQSASDIKTSKNPEIQAEVEETARKIALFKANKDKTPQEINQQARTLTAHHLIVNRIKERLGKKLNEAELQKITAEQKALASEQRAQETEEKMEVDEMTGLLNSKGFDKALRKEIARAQRSGEEIALVFFDLNGLGKTNNELGHAAGDARLRAAADILRASFRETDILARLGNKADEFIAALPMKDVTTIEDRYSDVDKNAQAANFNWEGYPIYLPAGAVRLDVNDIPGSIARADHAMYKAKELSQNEGSNVIRFEPEVVAV